MKWTLRLFAVIAVLAGASSPARAEDATPSVAVLETAAPDMTAAGTAVTRQLYATIARLGYRAAPESDVARLVARLGPRFLTPADLVGVARATSSDHAVQVTLTARGDQYVAALSLAHGDGTPPASASAVAGAADVEAAVDRLVRASLPRPTSNEDSSSEAGESWSHVRLALQSDSAFGLSERFFYNQFAGGRLDYAFTRAFAMGAYVGYANLAGREGRVHDVLSYLQLEYRLAFSNPSGILLPFRFGTGYLPKNGPFLRLAMGPSFPLSDSMRLGLDLFTPTFVIVHDRTVVSLDVAAELSFDL